MTNILEPKMLHISPEKQRSTTALNAGETRFDGLRCGFTEGLEIAAPPVSITEL